MQKAEGRMKKAEGKSPKPAVRGPKHPGAASRPASSFILHPSSFTTIPWWFLAVLLGLVTLALYWPATGFEFINYDDPTFVTANAHVQGGLNWEGVKWAFGLTGGDYWHPLTWLSLMLDASLFGQGAGGFHFTNVALHAANGVLLFLLLRMLTGTLWRSVAAAALFALHPLRVESVAWVAERKDVLSGCFGLLALIAYARYAQRRLQNADCRLQNPATRNPQPATRNTFHVSRSTFHANSLYLLSLGFLICGLMSKAMLVTWPFVMLLLDYWPLGRMENPAPFNPQPATRNTFQATRFTFHVSLLREKIPFFVLSGISCVLTYLTEGGKPEVSGFEASPALLRLENAFVAYARYLGKTFWPVNLAVPYTNPGHWSGLEVGGAVLVVVGVWLAALWLGRRRPYLLVGWCWFWGTLIPVIGLTKGWGCFMADRFTYMPSIGVLLLAVWGAYELIQGQAEGRGQRVEDIDTHHAPRTTPPVSRTRVESQIANRKSQILLWVAGGAAIVLCLALTGQQIGYWKDGESLFRHAVAATENNHIAYSNLAHAVLEKGQIDEAIGLYQEAIRLKPDDAGARCNLGVALGQKGQIEEAIRQFREAVRLNPDHADAHANLGAALASKGQIDEAITQFQEAIRLDPVGADAHHKLGAALIWKGQFDEAILQLQEAIRLKPDHAEAHYNLGVALGNKGKTDAAIIQYEEATRLNPGNADAHYNLGLALASRGQTEEAIHRFEAALKVKPDYPEAHNHLGLALVRQGHTDEAIRRFQEALRLKPGYAAARQNLDAVLASKAHSLPPTGPATNH
jgi:tetratricopeptide (TPR) repeat protein